MQVLVGLGNPGPKYERTRHNIGFLVLEELARRLGATFEPVAHACRTAVARRGDETVLLVEPLRYMNLTGEALRAWSAGRGVPLSTGGEEGTVAPLAICDDIALPLGSVRLRARGSDGGHRGLESLERFLGDGEYPRLRLGVGELEGVDPAIWADYVLERFPADRQGEVDELIERACAALLCVLDEGLEAAGSRHNRRIRPQAPPADE